MLCMLSFYGKSQHFVRDAGDGEDPLLLASPQMEDHYRLSFTEGALDGNVSKFAPIINSSTFFHSANRRGTLLGQRASPWPAFYLLDYFCNPVEQIRFHYPFC